jgi:hypothetical protein
VVARLRCQYLFDEILKTVDFLSASAGRQLRAPRWFCLPTHSQCRFDGKLRNLICSSGSPWLFHKQRVQAKYPGRQFPFSLAAPPRSCDFPQAHQQLRIFPPLMMILFLDYHHHIYWWHVVPCSFPQASSSNPVDNYRPRSCGLFRSEEHTGLKAPWLVNAQLGLGPNP